MKKTDLLDLPFVDVVNNYRPCIFAQGFHFRSCMVGYNALITWNHDAPISCHASPSDTVTFSG